MIYKESVCIHPPIQPLIYAVILCFTTSKLEEIIYYSAPSARKESAKKVADELIQAVLAEQKRIAETGDHEK